MERIHLPIFVMLFAVILMWGALGLAKAFVQPSQTCPQQELPRANHLTPEDWQIT
jgi:hypothetical protein